MWSFAVGIAIGLLHVEWQFKVTFLPLQRDAVPHGSELCRTQGPMEYRLIHPVIKLELAHSPLLLSQLSFGVHGANTRMLWERTRGVGLNFSVLLGSELLTHCLKHLDKIQESLTTFFLEFFLTLPGRGCPVSQRSLTKQGLLLVPADACIYLIWACWNLCSQVCFRELIKEGMYRCLVIWPFLASEWNIDFPGTFISQ